MEVLSKEVTAEEVRQRVADARTAFWSFHDCSLCGYACGFIFSDSGVFYDSGCDCVRNPSPMRKASYAEVAAIINRQSQDYRGRNIRNDFWRSLGGENLPGFNIQLKV